MEESKTVNHHGDGFTLHAFIDPFNKRVRVDDFRGKVENVIAEIEQIAHEHHAEKIIFKTRWEQQKKLLEHGYRFEGMIDGYFLGSDCYFFSKFKTKERKSSEYWLEAEAVNENIMMINKDRNPTKIPSRYKLKKLTEIDADELAKLYKQVFSIYPTPLDRPDYIIQTMKEGTIYYGFEHHGQIVSAASAEVNRFYRNAELTDCATLKDHRKYGLMKHLLFQLEKELKASGVFCTYSIARSLSYGMNAALKQLGYAYRGRLIHNCYIFDKLEDMNIWVRHLADE